MWKAMIGSDDSFTEKDKEIVYSEATAGVTFQSGLDFFIGVFIGGERTLVHEICHAMFILFGAHSVKVREGKPNEVYCMAVDYLFDELKEMV